MSHGIVLMQQEATMARGQQTLTVGTVDIETGKDEAPQMRPASVHSHRSSAETLASHVSIEQKTTNPLITFYIYLIIGCLIIGSPAIAILIIHPDYVPKLDPDVLEDNQLYPRAETVRWFLWLTAWYAQALVWWFWLDILPSMIVTVTTRIFGYASEEFRERLEKIPSAKWWIWFMLSNVLGFGLFLIIFIQFPKVPRWNSMVTFLAILTIFSVICFLQRLAVLAIADSFHRHSYQDRIIETKRSIKILDHLRGALKEKIALANLVEVFDFQASDELSQRSSPDEKRSSIFNLFRKPEDSPPEATIPKIDIIVPPVQDAKMDPPKGASVPSKGAAIPSRETTTKEAVDSPYRTIPRQESTKTHHSVRSRNELKSQPNNSEKERELLKQRLDNGLQIGNKEVKGHKSLDLLSEENGLRLAQKLFIALCPPDQSEITLDQFLPYFDSDEAAKEAFELFDRDHSGSLSLREVKQNILRIYRDRRSLYQSLGDLSQALGRLNQILYVFSILLTLLCSMPLLGISISAILPVTSLLVALSFVFGPAAGNTFNCIVFLFVYHPFDSGDRVFIDGSNYIVSELNLLTTVLIRSDGQKVYAPNNQLATKFIHNIRRSAAMAEAIEFQVSVDTPDDKLHLLEKKLNAFIKEAPKDYNPAYTSLSIYEVQDSNKMKISFWLSYKSNWQDMSRRIKPRTAFIRHLRNCMLSLGISYTLPPQPYVNMKHD